MIRLIAELKCPKHPRYKAVRPPSGTTICSHCEGIWYVVQNLRRISKRYTIQHSDKVWPVIEHERQPGEF